MTRNDLGATAVLLAFGLVLALADWPVLDALLTGAM